MKLMYVFLFACGSATTVSTSDLTQSDSASLEGLDAAIEEAVTTRPGVPITREEGERYLQRAQNTGERVLSIRTGLTAFMLKEEVYAVYSGCKSPKNKLGEHDGCVHYVHYYDCGTLH